jgi:hypothetical protein
MLRQFPMELFLEQTLCQVYRTGVIQCFYCIVASIAGAFWSASTRLVCLDRCGLHQFMALQEVTQSGSAKSS